MDIRIYIGAHRTAGQHIASILSKNAEQLSAQGILVADHATQLPAFRDAQNAIQAGKSVKKISKTYLEAVTKGAEFEKLVIIDNLRCGSAARPARKSLIFPQIRINLGAICKNPPCR